MNIITASVLLIGNELLSGRTEEKNIRYIARGLRKHGISLSQVRIVGDLNSAIIKAVNDLRKNYDYVFTTGGIGSTHDDITTVSIASALGVELELNRHAFEMLKTYYEKRKIHFNETRQKMAIIPVGASLIENKISVAPGYRIENIFVMAGIPKIMQSMFDEILLDLPQGPQLSCLNIRADKPEGEIAADLALIQDRFPDIMIGSYPFFSDKGAGVNIVLQGYDDSCLHMVALEVKRIVSAKS